MTSHFEFNLLCYSVSLSSHLRALSVGSSQDMAAKWVNKEQHIELVVSTHLKNISQNGNLPQTGVKIKHV